MNNSGSEKFILSADIGGSHITAAVIDVERKVVLKETQLRARVDSRGTAPEILDVWVDTLNSVLSGSKLPVSKLALAMPGPFDYSEGISYIKGFDKYESIYGLNVKHYLADKLNFQADRIVFRNDAEAYLQGEVEGGAAKGGQNVIAFTLGTGMGSAKSVNGVTTGLNWGGLPFGESIADDYFSTRWFLNAYEKVSTIKCRNVQELAGLVYKDSRALLVFEEFARNFAAFIAKHIEQDRPAQIIIGGNIAKAHHLFIDKLKDMLAGYISAADIKLAMLEEDAALVGAAFTAGKSDKAFLS
jgi:glucokinase